MIDTYSIFDHAQLGHVTHPRPINNGEPMDDLTTSQRALLRQAPNEWTALPRISGTHDTIDSLERKGLIETRTVRGLSVSRREWKIVERRHSKGNDHGND